MAENCAVVTVAHGRHDHLRRQRHMLEQLVPAVTHVVVAMQDEAIAAVCGESGSALVLHDPGDPRGLPLARARNTGADAALAAGAEVLIFLDVDCLPGPDLVSAYLRAAERLPQTLLSGPVTYLPETAQVPDEVAGLPALTSPHPARPAPPPGDLLPGADPRLFWSLSAAVTAQTWRRLGGFHEGYVGYGAEDTDLGMTARAADLDHAWVGGAHAYHQYHPVSRPPVEHLDDILRNARLFHDRWQEWPMQGWLTQFEELGLLTWAGGVPVRA